MSETAPTLTETTSTPQKPAKKQRQFSQERVMLLLTFAFISGVVVYSITPADSVTRDVALTLYVGVLMFAFVKYTT